MKHQEPSDPLKPKCLGNGYIKRFGDKCSVTGWLCTHGEMVFHFTNGDKVTNLRLSKDAIEALREVIYKAPFYVSQETLHTWQAEQELLLAS